MQHLGRTPFKLQLLASQLQRSASAKKKHFLLALSSVQETQPATRVHLHTVFLCANSGSLLALVLF